MCKLPPSWFKRICRVFYHFRIQRVANVAMLPTWKRACLLPTCIRKNEMYYSWCTVFTFVIEFIFNNSSLFKGRLAHSCGLAEPRLSRYKFLYRFIIFLSHGTAFKMIFFIRSVSAIYVYRWMSRTQDLVLVLVSDFVAWITADGVLSIGLVIRSWVNQPN